MGAYKDFNDKAAGIWTFKGWMFLPFFMAIGGIAIAPALAAAGAASSVAAGGTVLASTAAGATTTVATAAAASATTISTTAAAATTVSNGSIWLQWFTPFFVDPITGATGIEHGLSNIFAGVGAYATSGYELISSGIGAAFDPNVGVIDAISNAWDAPNSLPSLMHG